MRGLARCARPLVVGSAPSRGIRGVCISCPSNGKSRYGGKRLGAVSKKALLDSAHGSPMLVRACRSAFFALLGIMRSSASVMLRTQNYGQAPSHRAVREMKTDGQLPANTTVRSSKYLNNLIEQDHRSVKLRIGPMLGFKWFRTAAITIAGIGLRIHKGQFDLRGLCLKDRSARG